MNLQQLSNLIDTWAGDHFDPQNRWNEEVVFMDVRAPQERHMIHSLEWSCGEGRWILSGKIPDGEY